MSHRPAEFAATEDDDLACLLAIKSVSHELGHHAVEALATTVFQRQSVATEKENLFRIVEDAMAFRVAGIRFEVIGRKAETGTSMKASAKVTRDDKDIAGDFLFTGLEEPVFLSGASAWWDQFNEIPIRGR